MWVGFVIQEIKGDAKPSHQSMTVFDDMLRYVILLYCITLSHNTTSQYCTARFTTDIYAPSFPLRHCHLIESLPSFLESCSSMATSMSDVKKRSISSANSKVMDAFENTPEARAQTLVWDEAPAWQQDNKYILTGYRPGNTSYSEVFTSLTILHNETCNIYTHLMGALLLPLVAASFVQVLSEPRFPSVAGADYVALGIFFCSAECCLVFSTAYHLMECHSYSVEQFCLRMDLLGIIAATVGTSASGIYYVFACEPSLQKLHWTVVRHICGRTKANSSQSLHAKADVRSPHWES